MKIGAKIYIKNMVCQRCILAVQEILGDLELTPIHIQLGEVVLAEKPTDRKLQALKKALEKIGFELLDDARKKEIEKIKTTVIENIHYQEGAKFSFPKLLSRELNKEYSQISKLFSETEGITIEQFVIMQKIEKTKELLAYRQMNLNEISFELGYSSAAHLSAQFKKLTGLTPSAFKKQGGGMRKPLDAVGNSNRI